MAEIKKVERHIEVNTGDYLLTVESNETDVYLIPKENGLHSAFSTCAWIASGFMRAYSGQVTITLTEYDSPSRQRVIRKVEIS